MEDFIRGASIPETDPNQPGLSQNEQEWWDEIKAEAEDQIKRNDDLDQVYQIILEVRAHIPDAMQDEYDERLGWWLFKRWKDQQLQRAQDHEHAAAKQTRITLEEGEKADEHRKATERFGPKKGKLSKAKSKEDKLRLAEHNAAHQSADLLEQVSSLRQWVDDVAEEIGLDINDVDVRDEYNIPDPDQVALDQDQAEQARAHAVTAEPQAQDYEDESRLASIFNEFTNIWVKSFAINLPRKEWRRFDKSPVHTWTKAQARQSRQEDKNAAKETVILMAGKRRPLQHLRIRFFTQYGRDWFSKAKPIDKAAIQDSVEASLNQRMEEGAKLGEHNKSFASLYRTIDISRPGGMNHNRFLIFTHYDQVRQDFVSFIDEYESHLHAFTQQTQDWNTFYKQWLKHHKPFSFPIEQKRFQFSAVKQTFDPNHHLSPRNVDLFLSAQETQQQLVLELLKLRQSIYNGDILDVGFYLALTHKLPDLANTIGANYETIKNDPRRMLLTKNELIRDLEDKLSITVGLTNPGRPEQDLESDISRLLKSIDKAKHLTQLSEFYRRLSKLNSSQLADFAFASGLQDISKDLATNPAINPKMITDAIKKIIDAIKAKENFNFAVDPENPDNFEVKKLQQLIGHLDKISPQTP